MIVENVNTYAVARSYLHCLENGRKNLRRQNRTAYNYVSFGIIYASFTFGLRCVYGARRLPVGP